LIGQKKALEGSPSPTEKAGPTVPLLQGRGREKKTVYLSKKKPCRVRTYKNGGGRGGGGKKSVETEKGNGSSLTSLGKKVFFLAGGEKKKAEPPR